MVQPLLDFPALGQRVLLVRQQQRAGQQGLAEFGQQGLDEVVPRDAHAHRLLLGVQQPAGNFLGGRQDERVAARRDGLDAAEHVVADVHELPQLREVPADQREVVLAVQPGGWNGSCPAPPCSPAGRRGRSRSPWGRRSARPIAGAARSARSCGAGGPRGGHQRISPCAEPTARRPSAHATRNTHPRMFRRSAHPTCTQGRLVTSGSASRSTSRVTGAISPSPRNRKRSRFTTGFPSVQRK
jgi:hypothetical protein